MSPKFLYNPFRKSIFVFYYRRHRTFPLTSSTTSQFFSYKDGIDYDKFCMSLKNQYDQFTGPVVIHSGYRGGIGHKSIFLFQS